MFMIYITIMLTSIVTLLYLHINGHLDLVHIFGRNFADVDNEHRSSKMFREQRERTAWERSRKKKVRGSEGWSEDWSEATLRASYYLPT